MPIYDDPFDLDDDFEVPLDGRLRRRRNAPLRGLFLLIAAVALAVGIYSASNTVEARMIDDATCLACHTDQHEAYFKRAEAALAGGLALDLSSYHYQQIRGQGGSLNCIDCHRGDGKFLDHLDTLGLSTRISLAWLLRGDTVGIEAGSAPITDTAGIATLTGSSALIAPHLANDSCISCHTATLLTAGIENHMHNTLPVAYQLWKNGAPLSSPRTSSDAQSIVSRGLALYETTLRCSDCHVTHHSTDAEHYLHTFTVQRACVQCHTENNVAAR
jgi:mono/diheme cytochrome c family protein